MIRVQVERLPNKQLPPRPLWLAGSGPLPTVLSTLRRWYLRRFTVEHAFRFFKQNLGWTTVRPRNADTADRWTWLVASSALRASVFSGSRRRLSLLPTTSISPERGWS